MPSVNLTHHKAKELIYLIQSFSSLLTLLQNVTIVTSLFCDVATPARSTTISDKAHPNFGAIKM